MDQFVCRKSRPRVAGACALWLALVVGLLPDPAWAQGTQVPEFLRLADAVRIALEGSTELGIGRARLDATRKSRLSAIWALGPGLSLSATEQRSTRTDFAAERTFIDSMGMIGTEFLGNQDEPSAFRQMGASAQVRLFDGLANYYRIGAANNEVRANELDLLYTQTSVATAAIEAYYNLLRAKLLLRVTIEAEAVSREQLERTQALYELGSAARSDVLKSQVQLGQTNLDLVRARNNERQARDGLIYAMNLTRTNTFEIDTTAVNIPEESIDYRQEVDHALANRLDLQALNQTVSAAGKRTVAARGALWPSVDFGYSFSQSENESNFRFGSGRTRNRAWQLRTDWDIFDRYQTYANIGQAKADRRIAEYNRKQVELEAIREIRNYVNQLQEARERFGVASDNVRRSEEDLRLAQEKFRVGAGTILDTITAESDLTSTKASVVEAVVDYLIARTKLARATGRPFAEL